jgi:O-antigen ligase
VTFEAWIWLVPVGVLVAGSWRPYAGLVALVAALPLFGSPPGGPYLAALDAAGIAAIATAWRAGPAPRSRLDLPILAFVLVSALTLLPISYRPPSWSPRELAGLLSVFPSVEPWTTLYSWRALANLLLGWGLFVATRRAFSGRSWRPLALAFGGGALLVQLLGLIELTGAVSLDGFRAMGLRWSSRLHSTFFHSGWLAQYLVAAVPLGIGALWLGQRWRRGLALMLLSLTPLTLFLTQQRGAWVAFAAQLVVAAILIGHRTLSSRRWLVGSAVLALVTLLLGGLVAIEQPQAFEAALERTRDLDLAGRRFVWDISLEMLGERPVLGWGLGGFSPAFHHALGKRLSHFDWLTAHNHLLMLAAERGLVGVAAFAAVFLALVLALRDGVRGPSPEPRFLHGGLVVALGGLFVYSLVQYLFFLKMMEWLIWMLLALAAREAPASASRLPARLAAVCALLALALAPWRAMSIEPLRNGDREYGLHLPEQSGNREFRWTEGRASLRLERGGGDLVIRLANGHPRAGENPVDVVVRADGEEVLRTTLTGGWKRHRLRLGEEAGPWVVLRLEARPSFRPFNDFGRHEGLDPSTDIRRLGVALGRLEWEP